MSVFTTNGVQRVGFKPRYESAPYRMHPGRRESLYGRVQGIADQRRVPLSVYAAAFAIATFAASFIMGK